MPFGRFLRAFLTIIALSSSASNAAEPPMLARWTGVYAGITVGTVTGAADARTLSDCPPMGYYCAPTGEANGHAINALGTGSMSSSALAAGLHAGINWRSGRFVFGPEIDYTHIHLNASRFASQLVPFNGGGTTFGVGSSIETNWLLTARARVGYLASRSVLLYLTGGLAVSDIKTSNVYRDNLSITGVGPDGQGFQVSRNIAKGWTVGGGIEWALDPRWSFKGEYLYVDLGDVTVASSASSTAPIFAGRANIITTTTDFSAHVARFGLNYRF